MTPPLSRDLRSPCGLPAARLSGKPKQKDSENGKALKNRGLRGSKRIYRNFVAVLNGGSHAINIKSARCWNCLSTRVNIGPLGEGLIGAGEVEIILTVGGKQANAVTVTIQ